MSPDELAAFGGEQAGRWVSKFQMLCQSLDCWLAQCQDRGFGRLRFSAEGIEFKFARLRIYFFFKMRARSLVQTSKVFL